MSFADLFSIYNDLLSTKEHIKRLYENWDFGKQKQETGLAANLVGRASIKIYDLIMDEYPDMADIIVELPSLRSASRANLEGE